MVFMTSKNMGKDNDVSETVKFVIGLWLPMETTILPEINL